MNLISSEFCAFVGPSHECTASVASRIWVLGRDSDNVYAFSKMSFNKYLYFSNVDKTYP
ncbi:hypothetical protein SLEP1_g22816 [Rubroshorea leprosula]|uniref:Uncharacterized protein n=1 Tax=Rubroshorea leprosula TaxID=152421 RepID=A0AAV5JJM0_9ROSI|nr:hypothetical protein SLEP1_g22816 [Rubroshorea leprosula]